MGEENADRRLLTLRSAGRELVAEVPAALVGSSWTSIARRLPGVAADRSPVEALPGTRAVVVPEELGTEDVRRWLGALLHRVHLDHDTLCAHAVCLQAPEGGAVALLGGHGAGKTLVAMALAARGWRVLAGDVALLDCSDPGRPAVLGGTSAMVVRRQATVRWFPELALPVGGPARVDVGGLPGLSVAAVDRPVALRAGLLVHVTGDPATDEGPVEPVDRHTAVHLWARASGHLVERVLETRWERRALRDVEDRAAHARRLVLVHALAECLPPHAAWGTPQRIAADAELLVTHRGGAS